MFSFIHSTALEHLLFTMNSVGARVTELALIQQLLIYGWILKKLWLHFGITELLRVPEVTFPTLLSYSWSPTLSNLNWPFLRLENFNSSVKTQFKYALLCGDFSDPSPNLPRRKNMFLLKNFMAQEHLLLSVIIHIPFYFISLSALQVPWSWGLIIISYAQ